MSERPRVLLSHTFPPEHPKTVDDFASVLRDRRPDIDLVWATNRFDFVGQASDAHVLIEHGLPDEVLDDAPDLEWIQSLSAGVNRYDTDQLAEMGVTLTTISGAHAPAIAQQTIAYMLLFERNLLQGLDQAAGREWRRYPTGELTGRTVGVVGVGAVGGEVADLASAFDMEVLGLRQHPDRPHPSVDEMYGESDLHELLGAADYVVLACPLTSGTRNLIDEGALSSMRGRTVLLNVARGRVVDQSAMVDALTAGDLAGAALDVADPEPIPRDSPLWDLSNVIITPHNAGGSQHFPQRCADVFLQNYDHFIDGNQDAMKNRVV